MAASYEAIHALFLEVLGRVVNQIESIEII